MAKIFKTKGKWKSILCGILVVATLIVACAGIAAIAKKDTKTISSLAFEQGGLNAEGVFDPEIENAIFTEEMFECMGLVIETDVKFTDSFEVFFYNYDGVFLSKTDSYTKTTRLDVPELAKYARVVITSDEEIGFFDVYKHARLLDIKVNKEQNFELYNYFVIMEEYTDKIVSYTNTEKIVAYQNYLYFEATESENNVLATGWSPVKAIKVNGWKNLVFRFNDAADSKDLVYFFTKVNSEGNEEIVPAGSVQKRLNGGMTEFIIEVPEGAEILHTNTLTDAKHHYIINQYN